MVTSPPPADPPSPPGAAPHRPARRGPRVGLATVAVLALAIALVSLATYGTASLDTLAAEGSGLGGAYAAAHPVVQAALYVHVVSASLALVLGPWQFVARLRRRRPGVHRAIGRVYLGAVGVAAVSSLVMLPVNSAGLTGVAGFGALAALWVVTGVRGLRAIRRGDVASHQAWMLRSYALTFAAVTLRLWTGALIGAQAAVIGPDLDPEAAFATAYAVVPFLCWLPNLVVAELLVRRRGLPSYALPAVAPAVPSEPSAPPPSPPTDERITARV